MLNATNTETDARILADAQTDRDEALATWKAACKRVQMTAKADKNHPLLPLYRDAMEAAEAEYELAEDTLRLVRDGYAHTYPHPVCGIHPFDGYMPGRG
jgi:hypothetical protein